MKMTCHYCDHEVKVRRFGRLKGTFRPHSLDLPLAWHVCYGTDRKPWPNYQAAR